MVKDNNVVSVVQKVVKSVCLSREVQVDFYTPLFQKITSKMPLLLINDGQDLAKMEFAHIINGLMEQGLIQPMCCIGIYCGTDRRNEYGTVGVLDYKGRGAKADKYEQFIFTELFPLIQEVTGIDEFEDKGFCGFSLGGLSAIDLVWRHRSVFRTVGIFSGSLWWRTVAQEDDGFDEDAHRIMHQKIRMGEFDPHLRFFFETGTQDEVADRNNNGIIDSIDDTISLIGELKKKGFPDEHIAYLELKDGRHDVETWGRAFPYFLKWVWPATTDSRVQVQAS